MQIQMIAGGAALLAAGYIAMYNRLRRLSVKVEEGSSGIDVALEKRYDLLSEEIEAVKKFLRHEYETYTAVTALRGGTELEEKTFEERRALSREAVDAIDGEIRAQSEKMAQIKKQLDVRRERRRRGGGKAEAKRELEAGAEKLREAAGQKIGLLASIQQGLGGVGAAVDALAEQYPVLYSSASMGHFQSSIRDAEEHLQAARRLYNANVSLYNQTIQSFPWLVVARLHGMEKAEFYEADDKKREFKVNFD